MFRVLQITVLSITESRMFTNIGCRSSATHILNCATPRLAKRVKFNHAGLSIVCVCAASAQSRDYNTFAICYLIRNLSKKFFLNFLTKEKRKKL